MTCKTTPIRSIFKNYNGPQMPFVGHDGNMYINLDEGDIIERGDYILDDNKGWILARNCFGTPAPNPCFSSHRKYRRRVSLPNVPDHREQSSPVHQLVGQSINQGEIK